MLNDPRYAARVVVMVDEGQYKIEIVDTYGTGWTQMSLELLVDLIAELNDYRKLYGEL